ncbi:hypothetical protein HRbin36_02810 [bacterium HR36]|nr:hypothetical protein HRbin36_02810 [bacterium HR36]
MAAVVCVGRVSLAEPSGWLARQRQGLSQYVIKRVWRFVANKCVRPEFTGRRRRKKCLLIVALDWVVIRALRTLIA